MCKLHARNRKRKVILQSYINKIEVADSPEDLKNYPEYDEKTFEKEAKEYFDGDLDSPTMWFLVSNEYYLRGSDGKEIALFKGMNIDRFNIWGRDNEGYIDLQNHKYYYIKDHLGSVRVVFNESNNIVSAQDYNMWGSLMEGRGFDSAKSKYKFTGKERDKESNYDYFGARYYDSRIGRWGSLDPLLQKHYDFSPYNYVLNNSIKFIDPDGKQELWIIKFMIENSETIAEKIGRKLGDEAAGGGEMKKGFGKANFDVDRDEISDDQDEIDNRNDRQRFFDEMSIQRKEEQLETPDHLKPMNKKKTKSMEELAKIMKKQIEEKEKEKNKPKDEKIWNDPIKVFKDMFGL